MKVDLPHEIIQEIYPGMPIIAAANTRSITNGTSYTIVDFTEEKITILDEDNKKSEITLEILSQCRIGFAQVYHQVQGKTLSERTTIWDTDHKYFTKIHLALGISRLTDPSLLDIA